MTRRWVTVNDIIGKPKRRKRPEPQHYFVERVFYLDRVDMIASLCWCAINGGCWFVETMNDIGVWTFRVLHPTYGDAYHEIANLDPMLLCEEGL
jgi:hypothetical protein